MLCTCNYTDGKIWYVFWYYTLMVTFYKNSRSSHGLHACSYSCKPIPTSSIHSTAHYEQVSPFYNSLLSSSRQLQARVSFQLERRRACTQVVYTYITSSTTDLNMAWHETDRRGRSWVYINSTLQYVRA